MLASCDLKSWQHPPSGASAVHLILATFAPLLGVGFTACAPTITTLNCDSDINPGEAEWSKVGSYPDAQSAFDHALVVLSMGLPCWVERDSDDFQHELLVEVTATQQVLEQLHEYDRENEEKLEAPSHETSSFTHSPGWIIYLLWVIMLLVFYRLQLIHPEISDLGASSSKGLVDEGQWWRPLTALFLHADFEHLCANLLSGLFFTTLVACSVGALRGWLLILACGTLGNTLTSILVHPEPYRSIGASTAVFAALGILSGLGLAWMFRFRSRAPWLRLLAPLIGGIVVLAMTGSGLPESNTDVTGHVFGFAAGVLAGALFGALAKTINCRANS